MLPEKEVAMMVQLLQQNGCRCSNDKREVFWQDEFPVRKFLCKCGAAMVVPVMMFKQ